MVKQNANEPPTHGIRHWNWRKSSTSIATWPDGVVSKSPMRSVSQSAKLKFGSRIVAWSGRRSTRWHQWVRLYLITWHRTVIHSTTTFIRRNLRTCRTHRTRGTFRVLVRDSTNCINRNHIKDIKAIRIMPYSATILILNIRKSSDSRYACSVWLWPLQNIHIEMYSWCWAIHI